MTLQQTSHGAELNPFSTRFVRPGALPYEFGSQGSLAALVEHFQAQRGWGQIIGPHGSGKSTLLATLLPELARCGKSLVHIALHEGERFDWARQAPTAWNEATQVVVDGYEQLGALARWRLRRWCRRRGAGLLVTAHTNVGLPTLWETRVEAELARELAARLLSYSAQRLPAEAVSEAMAACLARHPHDLREAFFALYDLYESQGFSRPARPDAAA